MTAQPQILLGLRGYFSSLFSQVGKQAQRRRRNCPWSHDDDSKTELGFELVFYFSALRSNSLGITPQKLYSLVGKMGVCVPLSRESLEGVSRMVRAESCTLDHDMSANS